MSNKLSEIMLNQEVALNKVKEEMDLMTLTLKKEDFVESGILKILDMAERYLNLEYKKASGEQNVLDYENISMRYSLLNKLKKLNSLGIGQEFVNAINAYESISKALDAEKEKERLIELAEIEADKERLIELAEIEADKERLIELGEIAEDEERLIELGQIAADEERSEVEEEKAAPSEISDDPPPPPEDEIPPPPEDKITEPRPRTFTLAKKSESSNLQDREQKQSEEKKPEGGVKHK